MKNLLPLLALAVGMVFTSCASSKMGKPGEPIFVAPVGVQAYSFRNYFPKDIPGTLDRIQAMGITEIEGGAGRIPPEEYKKMCDERGISIPSTGSSFNELAEDPMKVVETAKKLGSKFVMCAWVPHDRGNFSLADAQKAVAVFNTAGKVLADNGLTFCYHAHGYEFQPYGDGTLLDYIIENTDPKYVSFEMDIFWIQFGGGDPVALLKKYGKRWKLMHLKDMEKGIEKNLTGGTNVEYNVPLGTGQLDMRNILIEGRKIGIAHYFIEDESSSVVEQVPESIAFLRSLTY
ncbi:sugar phosphate isomerase/epimerase family protein [Flavilitoribacter nigricans]|uniref:Sugar phosphate isomerase n=1 Tax=Flavilitoribacter nigricans (strain ATCC 23147 / DSM 23189 / NBRC 102662 / NCIMB 1420 / SS-2) TaxID=1122177 RepID=A0A2D0NGY6_FLAN2|nr:sugar phosphate isomerase/epimerase [Flavilitoribacter nigricans]PHN07646.1 sugar phosphate isomerase [Flavilitoribacter nigricans DSM 23189 = NBRC 102662]